MKLELDQKGGVVEKFPYLVFGCEVPKNCRRNDGRVRHLTVSPLQSEVCPEPRRQASPSRLHALQLVRKNEGKQHLAIVDHFFETPNLKSKKSQKAQSDNDDKFNTLLERAQKKIEAQIAQSQQIFEQVTNNFLERITTAQQSTPTTSHDNEVTKQLVKEVVEESGGKWVDVVKKMGKQMDNFVS